MGGWTVVVGGAWGVARPWCRGDLFRLVLKSQSLHQEALAAVEKENHNSDVGKCL